MLTALAADSSNTTANIIAAVAGVITALGGLAGGTALLVSSMRTKRQVQSVHKIVNQQRTDMLRFQEALVRALIAAGIEVPIDQSLPPAPDHDPTAEHP